MKCYRYNNSHKNKKGYIRPKEFVCKSYSEDNRAFNETNCTTCLFRAGRTRLYQKTQEQKKKKNNNDKPELFLEDYKYISKYVVSLVGKKREKENNDKRI